MYIFALRYAINLPRMKFPKKNKKEYSKTSVKSIDRDWKGIIPNPETITICVLEREIVLSSREIDAAWNRIVCLRK